MTATHSSSDNARSTTGMCVVGGAEAAAAAPALLGAAFAPRDGFETQWVMPRPLLPPLPSHGGLRRHAPGAPAPAAALMVDMPLLRATGRLRRGARCCRNVLENSGKISPRHVARTRGIHA